MHDLVVAYLLLFFGTLVVSYLIQLLVAWCAYNAALPIPAEQREVEPVMGLVLCVPFVGTFLNFLVQPALSRSYRRWFAARGVTGEGDCGENLAWWCAIVSVGAWVPCLPLAGLSAIVLQVLYLLRLRRLCRRALEPGA
jgi:hypothetical protein